MQDLNAVIIGAGIGGLTTAIAFRQAGYNVEVYDRTQELRDVGAAISVWSNGIKVLNRLGLGEQIARVGGQMDRMTYYDCTGEVLTDFSLQPLHEQVGQRPYPVTRAELQQLLLEQLEPGQVRLGAKCVAVQQDDTSVTAYFEDGSQATGDLLVAADGSRSTLRDEVLGYSLARNYVGYVNWNGLVPFSPDLAPRHSWVLYVGKHQRVSLMPVSQDRFYFFFDVPLPLGSTSTPAQYQDELAQFFQGWAAPVQTLIQRLDPFKTNRIEIHDIDPLPKLVRGRIALLGDAGHGTAPDLGQGGCQAMEDAFVLTNYLHTTNISVEDALKRYEAARIHRVADIITRARQRAYMTHGRDPVATQQWYEELRQEDGTNIVNGIKKTILAGPLN